MAGIETVHQVVEKIEVKGAQQAQQAFNQLGGAADGAAEALGHSKQAGEQLGFGFLKTSKQADKLGESTKGAGAKSQFMAKIGESSLGKLVTGFSLASVAANLLTKAVDFVLGKFQELLARGMEVNRAFEAQQSRVQGLLLGLMDWEKIGSTDKVGDSLTVTNALMREFRDIGLDAATPIPGIEAAYSRLNSILAGTGRSQKDIVKFTRESASAAKIYGESAEQAGGIVAKAIFQGVVEGESAFAQAFKSQAQITSKMPIEDRIAKISSVLQTMGEPLKTVTDDTESWQTRLGIISDDILQRVTYPIYQKIGVITKEIVEWLRGNEDAINGIVTEATEWLETIWDVGKGIWDIGKGLVQYTAYVNQWGEKFKLIGNIAKGIGQGVSIIGTGLQLLVEQVRVLIDPSRGMGKLSALSTAIELKWHEIAKTILKVVQNLSNIMIPDFVKEKVPGVAGFFKSMEGIGKGIDMEIEQTAKRLRQMEKTSGLGPLTATTRAMVRKETGLEMTKGERDDLFGKIFGKKLKIQQNIGKIEIRQDFRDQDPDRVMIEFVRDLEALGERALQSSAGGEATALEAGATGG